MGLFSNIFEKVKDVINDTPPSMEALKTMNAALDDQFKAGSLEITSISMGSVGEVRDRRDAEVGARVGEELASMRDEVLEAINGVNLGGNTNAQHVDNSTSVESLQVASNVEQSNERHV